jgi:hypothetical protein
MKAAGRRGVSSIQYDKGSGFIGEQPIFHDISMRYVSESTQNEIGEKTF